MARHSSQHDLSTWLDSHGYRHSHARKQKTTGKTPQNPVLIPGSPGVSWANWSIQLSDAAELLGVPVTYGPTTRDAWKSGMSPDEYARSQGIHRQSGGHARIIHQPPTGRPVFAAHQASVRKRLPFSTRKCYACDSGEAVGVRDRRPEGGMIEAACARHADPTTPAYPSCAICQGPIKPTSYDVDGTFVHKACHTADIHGHARIIHQPPTGRAVFAAHERDHHITTTGRRALDHEQFALPPGPEEKRRGIKGRLPIDTIERARNALQRAPQMQRRGHITTGQLAEVRRAVHRAWPSIGG